MKKVKKYKKCAECESTEKPTEERFVYDTRSCSINSKKTAFVCEDCVAIIGVWENAEADGTLGEMIFGIGF